MAQKILIFSLMVLILCAGLGGTMMIQSSASSSSYSLTIKLFTNTAYTHPVKNHRAVEGSDIYVDIILVNSAGSAVVTPTQLQIQLTAASGELSATNVYINSGHSDTFSSFGIIEWVLPTTAGMKTSLSASGIFSGIAISGKVSILITK